MQRPLRLIEASSKSWKLDPVTKDLGIRGIRDARAALQAARPVEARFVATHGDTLFDADLFELDTDLDAA
ncbi:MAG: hypothetical protein ACI91O_001515 [Candidatus Poriferisodalaceae bacterium]|jgi:hypothetical protein